MASNWILHGITENKLGQVISPELLTNTILFLAIVQIKNLREN